MPKRRRTSQNSRRRRKSLPPRRTIDDYPDRKKMPGIVFTFLGLVIPIGMVVVSYQPGLKDERGVLTGGAFAAIVGSFWMCAGLACYEGDWCNCSSMLIEWLFFVLITLASIFIIVVNISDVVIDNDKDRDTAINFTFVIVGVLLVTQQWLTWMYICDCLDSDRDRKEKKDRARQQAWAREDEYWARRDDERNGGNGDVQTEYLPQTARETRMNLMHPQRKGVSSVEMGNKMGWKGNRTRSGSMEKTKVSRFYKPGRARKDSDEDLCSFGAIGCSPFRSKSASPVRGSRRSSEPARPRSLPPGRRGGTNAATTIYPRSNTIKLPDANSGWTDPNRGRAISDPGRTKGASRLTFQHYGEDL